MVIFILSPLAYKISKISFLTTMIILLFSLDIFADECISGKCTNGVGTYLYSNGTKYVGSFKNGKLNGKGTLFFANENDSDDKESSNKYAYAEKYIGEFKEGKLFGQGMLIFQNGNKYEGEFVDDTFNGKGTYTYALGSKY